MQNNYKILIVYSSGCGSTGEVARRMGDYLTEQGCTVTVQSLPTMATPDHYDGVIVGSAIRYDRWMRPSRMFVKNNQQWLSERPVAYFFNCLTLVKRTDRTLKTANQYANKIAALSPRVQPLSVGRFAGVLDFTKLPLVLRPILKLFSLLAGIQPGDYRDWNEIHRWTLDVSTKMRSEIEQRQH